MDKPLECKSCKTWEENMYWNRFNSFHFLVTLPPDFHGHLVLPEKFASHMKNRLRDKVTLKSPSGASWEIELQKSNFLLFVGNGWKDFVKAHNLCENCILMFKCEMYSSFEVLIFENRNQGSSCEWESAYFLKPCNHIEDKGTVVCVPRACGSRERGTNDGEISRTEILENFEEEGDSVRVREHPTSTERQLPKENATNKRKMIEKEKKDALQRAIQEETETSFTVLMRPTAVYYSFVLTIPQEWLRKHPIRKNQNVVLRVGEKPWTTNFRFSEKEGRGKLVRGWKKFALDNELEEFDVLVF